MRRVNLGVNTLCMNVRTTESQIDRLEQAMKAQDMNWADLARALDTTSQRVGNWKKRGSIPANEAWAVASAVRVSADWLIRGVGPQPGSVVRLVTEEPPPAYGDQAHANTGPANRPANRVPVISCVQAGRATEIIENLAEHDELEWTETSLPVRRYTFALRVEGDSMAPKFPPGVTLIVEPDMQAEPGDYVVARNGNCEGTFKRLVQDAGRLYLKPENPQYPMLEASDYTIVGVVREVLMRLK
ncbi:S24 family peptidase [Thioalkalivibrio sp. ALE6]|uniref:S24 family peptidase n=1 Tax=Thioalkalivibrio sp. ALE6 TaxID=1266908 RepID=UPI0018C8C8C2|nr:S24 family peptidase [Thioalkalivibrio sp. ALE6]